MKKASALKSVAIGNTAYEHYLKRHVNYLQTHYKEGKKEAQSFLEREASRFLRVHGFDKNGQPMS